MTESHFTFPVIKWKNFSIYGRHNTHAPVGGLSEASPDLFFVLFPNKMCMELLYGKYLDILQKLFMRVLEDEGPIILLLQ